MRLSRIAVTVITILVISAGVQGQKVGKLIINPQISTFTSAPLTGGNIVRRDTMTTPPPRVHHMDSFVEGIEKPYIPAGAIITGMIPDFSKAWAVAVTQDEDEFLQALPEYRKLIAENKWREANEVLYITTRIGVSTKVEQFQDNDKSGELPENIKTFFFAFSTNEFKKHGGCLTFIIYTRDPKKPVVKIGNDIGETIHGVLQIEKTVGEGDYEFGYAMKVIKAEIRE